jgi:glycopeptide antibiotics resistance protein
MRENWRSKSNYGVGVSIMLKEQLIDVLERAWPMLLIFTVILTSIRIAYLYVNKEKFVFYKEFFALMFMIYILLLFYVVTYQDPISNSISSYNLIPFREMFRYDIGTIKFFKNIVGNLLIFVPFGLFVSYYIHKKRFWLITLLSLISSVTIEFAQRLIIGRVFDVDDIILNVVGGCIGYIIYIIIDAITDHVPRILKKDWIINLALIIIIALIIIYIYNFNIGILKVLP